MSATIYHAIAAELQVRPEQVIATVKLIDEGNTVPFIARYRKEVTGGLDDTQLRQLDARLIYLRDLNERRHSILKSIQEQGKLTPELAAAIEQAETKTRLEDLYLPFKPKRRTKGQIAIEAGLAPLAQQLWEVADQDPEQAALAYVNTEKGIADTKTALEGARAILIEQIAEDAQLLAIIRHYLQHNAQLQAQVIAGKEEQAQKFADYFHYQEPISRIPSHRALALLRGRNEGFLTLTLNAEPLAAEPNRYSHCEQLITEHYGLSLTNNAADTWRKQVIGWAWRVKIANHMETEFISALKERAELDAIDVFARNLTDLLMAAPAGPKATLGIDPGLRTGCKVAVVDATGKVLATETIYPHPPHKQYDKAQAQLLKLIHTYAVDLIAIGNGTASRETDTLVQDLITSHQLSVQKMVVSEAGASVYSASELAAKEFAHLDVSLRGAVSIARRLQDPLAELVKIDPKAIGVGQYQHDVSQALLAKRLDAVVEDCVNAVGVDVNTASAALLTRVAGLSSTLAHNIVAYRDENGRFARRTELKKVPRLGAKAFEQCAGFLRIMDGANPLDASAVHPEAYAIVKKIAEQNQQKVSDLIGNSSFLRQLNAADYVEEGFGIPTVSDIIKELDKPGRDPRPEFKTAQFSAHITQPSDLKIGMILEGVVSNVASFGAFVDIGVHQDGLVHISALSDRFVSDPHQIVKAGDIVKVKVMEVDLARQRIALSMRLNDETHATKPNEEKPQQPKRQAGNTQNKRPAQTSTAMGNAFAQAFKK